MVALCDGMNVIATCATCMTRWLMARQHMRKPCGVTFEGTLIPFGANVSYKPISSKDEATLHQFDKKMLAGIFMESALCAGRGWSSDLLIADREDLENVSASEPRQTVQAPGSRTTRTAVVSM